MIIINSAKRGSHRERGARSSKQARKGWSRRGKTAKAGGQLGAIHIEGHEVRSGADDDDELDCWALVLVARRLARARSLSQRGGINHQFGGKRLNQFSRRANNVANSPCCQ